MDPDIFLPAVLPVVALLAVNAFFVTAEYSLLTLRRGRLESSGREHDRRGFGPAIPRMEEMLLLAQLGRSISTLGLGYAIVRLAGAGDGGSTREPTLGTVLLALSIGAVVHAVLGAQLPKLVGIHRADSPLAALVIAPLRGLTKVLRPLVWPLARLVHVAARWLGISAPVFQPMARTPEEIRILVSEGHEQGVVEEDEREMINGVFEFSETVAREVMTPRIDMVAAPVEMPLDDILELLMQEGHSRLPIYQGTIDTVVGVLLAKDLLPLLADSVGSLRESFDIRKLMREPYFVPDAKPVDEILAEFRQQSVHLAIVLDEFGGTSGLLTMEDLLEEIVGEINDEYDVVEEDFTPTPEGDVLIDGGVALSEVNERFGLDLPEEDFDTIGGFIFGALGRVPVSGDEIGGLGGDAATVLHVEEIEDRRITLVRLTRAVPAGKALRDV